MVRFCNDVDILKYEPALFGELHLASQVLAAGSGGELVGTTFTASGADFESAQVEPGGVIYLRSADGILDGAYEIAAVDSATQLCVSVLRADGETDPVAPPAASDISYRISTLRPQAEEVGFQLTQYIGIKPGDAASEMGPEQILDTGGLRRGSVFGVLTTAYAMLASEGGDENFWRKSLHYRRLFEKAKERCRVDVDAGSDGVADITRFGGCGRLVRE